MLTINAGPRHSFCDGVSRRNFLRVGGLALGGLALADLLRLQALGVAKPTSSPKSVIMIYLSGGPPQMDMYDLKPDAPVEIRGDYKPINTNVPGMRICEHLPLQAKLADKFAIVNGMIAAPHSGSHSADGWVNGFGPSGKTRPAIGAVVSKFASNPASGLPAWVGMGGKAESGDPSYLGAAHAVFTPSGSTMSDLQPKGLATENRQALLRSLDHLRSDLDPQLESMDSFTARALDMVTSTKVREAFDLSKESSKVKERYGEHTDWLLALRLAQAGVPMVTLSWTGNKNPPDGWDLHRDIFKHLKTLLPSYDQAVTALITDLYDRGLEKDVVVQISGEFGRTPRCYTEGKGNAGRGHYSQSSFALVAGGGLRTGQMIGDTGPRGEKDISRGKPYTYQNLIATLYQHVLGIDLETKVPDNFGRPMYLLDQRDPIAELV